MKLLPDEEQVVKQALRHYVLSSETRAREHYDGGYTAAAHVYDQHALIVRAVLARNFNDFPPR